ncbi:MAG TPA: DUF4139 domain-containing protein [Vicinamibacterales bacterium]|nr:DUF4139 domain-containing protein [Vicinamibacterales bacterium]
MVRYISAFALAASVGFAMTGSRADAPRAARTEPERSTSTTQPLGPTSTAGDQTDLGITIYNSNVALVRDVRQLSLPTGAFDLKMSDIAATVNPATVHLRSLTDPSRLGILEQNYQYDLLNPMKLLQKYVGRDVRLVRRRTENGTTRSEEVTATLLAFNEGPVWKIGNEIVTGLQADEYRFPQIPENLHSRPTLVMTLDNGGAQKHQVETSYLANSMNWIADYVLTVGRDDRAADLDGWVTVTNSSGTSFKQASLKLVAGDLHRVRENRVALEQMADMAQRAAAAPKAFQQEAFSEYHLYTLGRKTTILDKETKQISFLSGTSVPVAKRFVVHGQQFYYRNRQHPGSPLKDAVQVFYVFKNAEKSNLGQPMPAGTVRVYQSDASGGVQFVGEDRIGHTPVDEELSLQIGNAFDVVCERKQTDYTVLGGSTYEMAFEITLRNHKKTPITVQVNEPIAGDWTMVQTSHNATKTEAWAARFDVPVAAGGASVLRYRVRVRF